MLLRVGDEFSEVASGTLKVGVRGLALTAVDLRRPLGAKPFVSLADFGGATIPAYGTWIAAASTVIHRPRLWSTDHPALYRATLTVERVQQFSLRFGF